MPPPEKVLADADVRLIVPVPVTVRLVDVAVLQAAPAPEIVHVPEPIAIVLVLELVLENVLEPLDKETLYEEASNVPLVTVKTPPTDWLKVKASCSVTDPPGVLIVNVFGNVLPALVIV